MSEPQSLQALIEDVENVAAYVTDWDLCPFCIREGSGEVGVIADRHEKNCLKPRLIAVCKWALEAKEALEIADDRLRVETHEDEKIEQAIEKALASYPTTND